MHHLDAELLQAAVSGDLPVKVLMRQLLAHMAELCPECAATVRALQQAVARGEVELGAAARAAVPCFRTSGAAAQRLADPRHVGAFENLQAEASSWASRVRREQRLARSDLRELLRTPREDRARRIERARSRYRSRAVAELLLQESRHLVRRDPAEARSLAELVERVLTWIPSAAGAAWARELAIRARASVANAYRVECDFRAAQLVFADVRARMSRDMAGEAVHAEVASLEASLCFDQGRTEEARRLLDQAATLYRADGDQGRLARVLVKRALLEDRDGDSARAAELQREALRALQGADEPQLVRESIANLALFLVDGGRAAEAERVLAEHEATLAEAGMWEEPRLKVIRGRVALGRGREAEAEELFLGARAELIRNNEAVRAAVASMDLAVLYLAQGKCTDLRRMARLIGTIFESAELESEALAAVALFQKAVEQETVTEAAIRAWRRQLEVGRPGRRKAPPS